MDINITNKNGIILNTRNKVCEDDININIDNSQEILPENIAKDVTILGVTGSLEPSNIDQLISGEITTLNIPNKTTKIRSHAFDSCNNLTSITIPNSVTSIGSRAFDSCNNLTSITIPNSVTSIGISAFYNCPKLTSITIPNSVTNIEDRTFLGCSNLIDVTIENGFNANHLNLSTSTKYTHDTILSWLNALYDRSNLSAYTLTIGTTNLNKLTDEEKAIATAKNWTLA